MTKNNYSQFGLRYWFSESDNNGFIYSVDMIRISFTIRKDRVDDLNSYLNNINRVGVDMFGPSFKSTAFKYLFRVDYGENRIMSVGVGFNGFNSDDAFLGFLEFNPNKTFTSLQFWSDVKNILTEYCWSYDIKRFDLAIDFPYCRGCFVLHKDKRKYGLEMKSQADKTEYLGCRNNQGFLKLYNKELESKLDTECTRCELTLDFDIQKKKENFYNAIPELYIRKPQIEINNSEFELSSTHLAFGRCLCDIDNPDFYLNMISNKSVRSKLKKYVYDNSLKVVFDYKCYEHLFNIIGMLFDDRKPFRLTNYDGGDNIN